MKFGISVIALMTAMGAAHAADLIIDTPMVEPVAAASGLKGTIELGLLGTYADQSSWPFDGWAGGAYLGGNLWGLGDGYYWGVDGYLEGNTFENTYDEAPTYVGTLGGHLGFGSSDLMLGGFASVGVAPDEDDEANAGYTAGVEGLVAFDTVSLFGQLGYADIRTDDEDSGFTGGFARVGALFSLSDDFAVVADASYGRGDDFEDEGDWGSFWSAGLKAAWKLPTDFDAFLTAGYEYVDYTANTEDDAQTHTVKVGLAIPFGDSNTAADVLNPLGTSALPYRAASWGETLD